MRKLFLLSAFLLLTGCPSEEEIQEMKADMAHVKEKAMFILEQNDFSTEGLLKVHAYFFAFGEKVHLMKQDAEARDGIKEMIEDEGPQKFCKKYLISLTRWRSLESYCSATTPYRCSSDIRNYKTTFDNLLKLVGPSLAREMSSASACQ